MNRSIKFLLLSTLLVAVAAVSGFYKSERASATVLYSYGYDYVNVYNVEQITYSFFSLSAAVPYRWDAYTVNPQTGALISSIGFREFTGGTTTTVSFGGDVLAAFGGDEILWPPNYSGPIAIVDSNGTILGRHYVTQYPSYLNNPTSGWFSGAGNTALNLKQVIGTNRFYGGEGFCENPVYTPINSDGWQHTFKPCSVITLSDGYAILHYQIDPTYQPGIDPPLGSIWFFEIPTTNSVMEISLDDIIDYQTTGAYTGGTSESYSFLVVNTSGIPLPFVETSRAATAFVTADNPLIGLLDPGVYNYSRYDAGLTWESDGESVWIISDDPQLEEWRITANVGSVGVDSNQTLVTHAVTPEVWTAYHGVQQVVDSFSGYSNGIVYAFAQSRPHTYQVASTTATDNVVQWINRASAIFSGLATVAEMQFEVQTNFDIVEFPTFEDKINQVIVNTGLDTDSGSAALLVILLAGGMMITAAMSGLRGNVFIYLVVWTGIGGTYIVGGFGTVLVNTSFAVFTMALWVFVLAAAQGRSDESA